MKPSSSAALTTNYYCCLPASSSSAAADPRASGGEVEEKQCDRAAGAEGEEVPEGGVGRIYDVSGKRSNKSFAWSLLE